MKKKESILAFLLLPVVVNSFGLTSKIREEKAFRQYGLIQCCEAGFFLPGTGALRNRAFWLEPEPSETVLFVWNQSPPKPGFLFGTGDLRNRAFCLKPETSKTVLFVWIQSPPKPCLLFWTGALQNRAFCLKPETSEIMLFVWNRSPPKPCCLEPEPSKTVLFFKPEPFVAMLFFNRSPPKLCFLFGTGADF